MNGGSGGLAPGTPDGQITLGQTAAGVVLWFRGDVDAHVVEEFHATHPTELSQVVAVDVRELTYIDSTGLTLLVRWAQEAARGGRPAEIRGGTPRFTRVLEVAGIAPMFATG